MNLRSLWSSIRQVVLDWNGTLLDDFAWAVDSVNRVRHRHGLAPIDRQAYRAAFRFPIEAFYRDLGFDLQAAPYPSLMAAYLESFDPGERACPLHDGAEAFLRFVKAEGRGLSVLSASRQATLADAVRAKGIVGFFDHVYGLGDERAASKLEEARSLQASLATPPQTVLCVGDTTHDADVAAAVGWHAVLLTCGHQDEARLQGRGIACVRDLHELTELLTGSPSEDQS